MSVLFYLKNSNASFNDKVRLDTKKTVKNGLRHSFCYDYLHVR